ncbi:MAG: phosphoglycerate dehydrogenase-like oxidoreductase [Actinomycetia bacterium]|jgi:phosphoglycerate dehydrogenase-like enzyme|nr:phosphoglycerate dehydrogenase-like oxidoreductase [Actinomycetes bacterium]
MSHRPRVLVLTGGPTDSSPPLDVVAPLADIVLADSPEALERELPSADILFIWNYAFADLDPLIPAAERLRWIHAAHVGVDPLMSPVLLASDLVVTNSRGTFDTAIAEYVTGLLLAFTKDLYGTWRLQQQRQWSHRITGMLRGQRIATVGTGSIGRCIAAMLKALGAEITLVGRRSAHDPEFGTIVSSQELAAVAGRVDTLILAPPLTEHTRGMVDHSVLAALGPAGYLINIGRGPLVVEADLLHALSSGQIAGAALDVFDHEPLPTDSPLWTASNVVVSPHMSGDFKGFETALVEVFVHNLRQWIHEKPLDNVVDLSLGYVPRTTV